MLAKTVVLIIVALTCAVAAQYTAKDMHKLARLGDYALSSQNGLVYAVSQWSDVTNQTTSSLYLAGGVALTAPGQTRDSSPAFSPTDPNTVFFVSTRGGVSNVWVKSLLPGVGEYALTTHEVDVENVKITPNYVMFTAEVYEDCGVDFACTAEKDEWLAKNPNSGMVFDSLFVRHWDKIVVPGKASQLFTQAMKYNKASGKYEVVAQVTKITSGMAVSVNTPVPPDGGSEQISISPDYARIAFTGQKIQPDQAWTTGWEIYESLVNPVDGTPVGSSPGCVSCPSIQGPRTTNPSYDPNGKYLAFLAMDRPGFEADRLHLEILPVGSSSSRPVSIGWDRSVSEFAWSADGDWILIGADEDGEHKLFALNIILGTLTTISSSGTNSHIQVTASNDVYFSKASFNAPSDLYSFSFNPSSGMPSSSNPISPATRLNPSFPTSSFDPGSKFYYPSEDGSQVQGWFFKPKGFNPQQRYPFVLLIHGGPQGAWTNGWSYRWNPELWAQHGYAVAMINPHGSTGFGQAYCDAVSGNWGGIPFRDLMTGVDKVLANYTWIDPSRVSACGASYGGFMINWIQGNAPAGKFASLVVHDGLYDIPISYGSTDELWFPEWEFKGTPWSNPSGYQKWNPANYVSSWKTPMLVVHGGLDYRVDLAHGLSAFTALQRKGIPSKFLYYALENHWVSKPTNSIQWYKEVLSWLDVHSP